MLPTIKRPPPGSNFSPTIEEGRVLGFPANSPGSDVPPPLVLQRPSLPGPAAYSRNPSQTSASFFFGNPHSRPVRQVCHFFSVKVVKSWYFPVGLLVDT